MPQLDPSQIHAVLRESGLKKSVNSGSLTSILEENQLDPASVIDQLGTLLRCGETDTVRLRAAELAFKLSGLLNDAKGDVMPVINIVIKDSEATINPILLPR